MKYFITFLLSISSLWLCSQEPTKFDITYCRPQWTLSPLKLYIEGCVTTYFKPIDVNTKTIDFDLVTELVVDSVLQRNQKLSYTHNNDKLVITLLEELPANTLDSISIYYKGEPRSQAGFGAFQNDLKNGSLWTISEAFNARCWWPCRQNLYDKIDSIDIFVTCDTTYIVATNGKLIDDVQKGSCHTMHYKSHHPMSYYTIGVAVGKYDVYTYRTTLLNNQLLTITDYVYKNNTLYDESGRKLTKKAIKVLGDYFGIYPFADEKYGQAQISWSGGIEHQTVTFLSIFSQTLINHELAHQWFGNYVTCASWRDIWINEAFASFCELLIIESDPFSFVFEKVSKYKQALEAKGTIYINDVDNEDAIFDYNTTYQKGAYTLIMLQNEIGEQNFRKGCQLILSKYANGFATIEDAQKCFEEAANTNLKYFFDAWIYHKGYPIYDITYKKLSRNRINIKINQKNSENDSTFYEMHLPFEIQTTSGKKEITLHQTMPQQEFTISVDDTITNLLFNKRLDILCEDKITEIKTE